MNDFESKVAVVTGASRGLGREVTEALLARGARVGAVGRDVRGLEDAAAGATDRALPIVADVRRAADAERAVADTVARFGRLDLLVNAAGVLRHGPLDELDEDAWDLIFDTNVKGCFLMTRFAVRAMRAAGGGAIVNVSSVYAQAATAGVAAYAASKAAVEALSRTAALDHVGDGIRVNCVAPGTMATPMVAATAAERNPGEPQAVLDAAAALHPIGRLVEPAEVTSLILFLLGEQSAGIVGACFAIDGGRSAKLGSAGSP